MKKLVTIFSLFTLVMLTSFVEPSEIGGGGKGTSVGTGQIYLYSDIGGGGKGTSVGTGQMHLSNDIGGGGKGTSVGTGQ